MQQRDACLVAFAHIFPPEPYRSRTRTCSRTGVPRFSTRRLEVYVAEDKGGSPSVPFRSRNGFPQHAAMSCRSAGAGVGSALHGLALERLRAHGNAVAKLWTLEENWNARRYYEKRGWTLTEETRVVPFPPQPLDVQYEKTL